MTSENETRHDPTIRHLYLYAALAARGLTVSSQAISFLPLADLLGVLRINLDEPFGLGIERARS
jgi:hypothetical protein